MNGFKLKTVCVLMSALMLITLTGCSDTENTPLRTDDVQNQTEHAAIETEQTTGDTELLIGEWEITHEIGYAELLNIDETNADVYPYVGEVSMLYPLFLRLSPDGTYSLSKGLDELKNAFAADFTMGLKKQFDEYDVDMSVDDAFELCGTTWDEATDRMVCAFYGVVLKFDKEGRWKAEDGKLYLEGANGEFDENDYITYMVSEKELEFSGISQNDADDKLKESYPVIMTRSPKPVDSDE